MKMLAVGLRSLHYDLEKRAPRYAAGMRSGLFARYMWELTR